MYDAGYVPLRDWEITLANGHKEKLQVVRRFLKMGNMQYILDAAVSSGGSVSHWGPLPYITERKAVTNG